MTYSECDKALKKYGFFLKKNEYGSFDKSSGSVVVVRADKPKNVTPLTIKSGSSASSNSDKSSSDNNTSPNKTLIANKVQLRAKSNGPFFSDGEMVGTISVGQICDFDVLGDSNKIPFCIIKIIYKLSVTPINKRRKDVKSLTVNSLKDFSKKLGEGSSKKISRKLVRKALSKILSKVEEN